MHMQDIELAFGRACRVLSDPSSGPYDIRAARETVSALAMGGHRAAIGMVLDDPSSYAVDLDAMIRTLNDPGKERDAYRKLFTDRMAAYDRPGIRRYALELLRRGDLEHLRYCDPREAAEVLGTMDEKQIGARDIGQVLKVFRSTGFTDRRWILRAVTVYIEDTRECIDAGLFLPNPDIYLGDGGAQVRERIINYLQACGTDWVRGETLRDLFALVDGRNDDLTLSVGIRLLERGDNSLLLSKVMHDRVFSCIGDPDPELFGRITEAAGSVGYVYSVLARNTSFTDPFRIRFSELAAEGDSEFSKLLRAKMAEGNDPLGSLRIYLECEITPDVASHILGLYERLAGMRRGDPTALELYRYAYVRNYTLAPEVVERLRFLAAGGRSHPTVSQ